MTIVEKGGYEADDLLGTIAKRSEAAGVEVAVVSGDRDLLQLATDHIKIRIPKTKRTGTEIEDYNAKEVLEKYQVTPTEFIDVKALMGDTSDNIREFRHWREDSDGDHRKNTAALRMPTHMWMN